MIIETREEKIKRKHIGAHVSACVSKDVENKHKINKFLGTHVSARVLKSILISICNPL